MGLADEIMDMVDRMLLMQRDGHVVASTATGLTLRARLTEIEQELASLRMDALQAESQRLGLYDDLDASHALSALPCPSEYVNAQTGYDREDGG